MRIDLEVLRRLIVGEPIELDERCVAIVPLLMYGLAARHSNGGITLTRAGERYLFQKDCRTVLDDINRGAVAAVSNDSLKWLMAAGFITESSSSKSVEVTRRGKVWLDSFSDAQV